MSSLKDLYREVILDHYRSPRNRGELETPPAIKSEGKNPSCGDELTLFLDIEDGIVQDVKMSGVGCSISQASTSMMTTSIKGKSIEHARELISAFKALMDIHESRLDGDSGAKEPQDLDSAQPDTSILGELEALTGVVKFPVRIKCATLAFNTLSNGLDAAEAGKAASTATTE
jgi:nitrogen fixation NifU-like protein